MEELNISDKQRIFKILAVAATAIGKFVFMDFLNWRLPFVVFSELAGLLTIFTGVNNQVGFKNTGDLEKIILWHQ